MIHIDKQVLGNFESVKIRMGINGKNITVKEFLEVVTSKAEFFTWWRFVLSEDSKELIVMKRKRNPKRITCDPIDMFLTGKGC